MAGIFLQHEGALLPVTEAPYATEALLQELVAQHPETLAGDREAGPLLLVRREAAVYDEDDVNAHGSLDHLFPDGQGIPVLVEVKRSTDSRIRREVVGQSSTTPRGPPTGKSNSSRRGSSSAVPQTSSTPIG